MVTPEDHNRLLSQAQAVNRIKQSPHLSIEIADRRQITVPHLYDIDRGERLSSATNEFPAVVPGNAGSIAGPVRRSGRWQTGGVVEIPVPLGRVKR